MKTKQESKGGRWGQIQTHKSHALDGSEKKLEVFEKKRDYKILLILIIHRFYSWNFAYLLKFICNLKISTSDAFVAMCGCALRGSSVSPVMCTFLAEGDESDALPSSVSPVL